jgi:uncharacterized membrane protein YfcA
MWEYVALFAVGFIVSAFGTIVGFGGGVFMVPILVLIFNIPIQLAIGCVILALFPSALNSTVWKFRLSSGRYSERGSRVIFRPGNSRFFSVCW